MEVFQNPLYRDIGETQDWVPGSLDILRAADGSKISCLTILHETKNSIVRLVDHEAFAKPLIGKFYNGDLSEEAIQRFRNEADILTMFREKDIPYFRGLGEYKGRPYILMDVISGVSLQAISDANDCRPLPLRAVKCIGAGLASTLASIHEAGVVHRDIKPGNAILRDDGGVSIIDFGLACRRRGDELRLTSQGQTMGTPRYLAPESLLTSSRNTLPASDIYGLGLILTELAMGKHPMSDDQIYARTSKGFCVVDHNAMHVKAEQEIANKDRPLGALLGRMFSADLSGRPTAAEIVEALSGMTLERYRSQQFKNRSVSWKVPTGTRTLPVLSVFGETKESAAHAMIESMQRMSSGSLRRNVLIGAGAVTAIVALATLSRVFDVFSGESPEDTMDTVDRRHFNPFDQIGKKPEEGVEISPRDGQPCVWIFRLSRQELQELGIQMDIQNEIPCTIFYRERTSFLFVPGKGIYPLGSTTEEDIARMVQTFPAMDGPISIPPGFSGNEVLWRSTVNGRLRALQADIRERMKNK